MIKEEGKFLDLTGVPPLLKLRSGLGKYLYLRDCYEELIADIIKSLPKKARKTIAILGTAGIGKSSLFLVILKRLFQDPSQFGLETRSFYFQTRQDKIRLFHHDTGDMLSVRFVPVDEESGMSMVARKWRNVPTKICNISEDQSETISTWR